MHVSGACVCQSAPVSPFVCSAQERRRKWFASFFLPPVVSVIRKKYDWIENRYEIASLYGIFCVKRRGSHLFLFIWFTSSFVVRHTNKSHDYARMLKGLLHVYTSECWIKRNVDRIAFSNEAKNGNKLKRMWLSEWSTVKNGVCQCVCVCCVCPSIRWAYFVNAYCRWVFFPSFRDSSFAISNLFFIRSINCNWKH